MNEQEFEQALEKAAAAGAAHALKNAGLAQSDPPPTGAPQDPAADPMPQGVADAVEQAVAKGFEGLDARIDDKITKALAKGAGEADPAGAQVEESIL